MHSPVPPISNAELADENMTLGIATAVERKAAAVKQKAISALVWFPDSSCVGVRVDEGNAKNVKLSRE